jgi:hypothetical protein
MNRKPTGLNASKAITGFLHYKSAEGLMPTTVDGYLRDLKLWLEYQGHLQLEKITTHHSSPGQARVTLP